MTIPCFWNLNRYVQRCGKLDIYLRKTDEAIGTMTVVAVQYQETIVTGIVEEGHRYWREVLLRPQRPQFLIRPAIG
jgi:hypothetical protein